jgi:spermidine/putrescine transport system permease protein
MSTAPLSVENAIAPTRGDRDEKSKARVRHAAGAVAWLALPIAWFFVFILAPYVINFYFSVGTSENYTFVPGFSLTNYQRIVAVQPYATVLLNSARIGALTALFACLIGYPVALTVAFGLKTTRSRFIAQLLIMLPWWASYLVKAYAWKTILGANGLINLGLIHLGIIEKPLSFLLYNEFSVVLTLTYIFCPFATLSILNQLERIPISLVEAASNFGANKWEVFTRIIFPISLPGVMTGAIVTFALSFGDFIAPALLGGSRSLMIGSVILAQLGVANNRAMAAAIATLIVAVAFVLIRVMKRVERSSTVRI